MSQSGDEGTGVRIANCRKLRGLTQRGLAMKANVAYGTLTKVESGHSMAQPAVLAAIARALSVNVTQLTGQPYLAELRDERLEELIEPLRIALDSYDLGPNDDAAPRPVAEIESEVFDHCKDIRAGLLGRVATSLPGLLEELSAVVAAHDADTVAWRSLAQAYRCVYDVASKWGYRDLAVVALDRMGWAGGHGGDPLVEPLRRYHRSLEYLRSGQYRHAGRLLDSAVVLAENAPPGRERSAVVGQAHLAGSINAARAGDGSQSEDHLSVAQEVADQVGEVPRIYWLGFGPTNLAVHRVAALIERSLYDDAIRTAAEVTIPSDWHATRAAHHFMDLGRAHAWLGQEDKSLAALRKARGLAPQQTRFHPTTRDTIEHLLETRRRAPESLANYARWVGM